MSLLDFIFGIERKGNQKVSCLVEQRDRDTKERMGFESGHGPNFKRSSVASQAAGGGWPALRSSVTVPVLNLAIFMAGSNLALARGHHVLPGEGFPCTGVCSLAVPALLSRLNLPFPFDPMRFAFMLPCVLTRPNGSHTCTEHTHHAVRYNFMLCMLFSLFLPLHHDQTRPVA